MSTAEMNPSRKHAYTEAGAPQLPEPITLNKPTLFGEDYIPRNDIGNFYNISATSDWIQWLGSDAKMLGEFSTDENAINHAVDTSSSSVRPHAALIWDHKIRNIWWNWFLNQQGQGQGPKTDNGCATNPNAQCIYSPIRH
jgi:hypothetical protein